MNVIALASGIVQKPSKRIFKLKFTHELLRLYERKSTRAVQHVPGRSVDLSYRINGINYQHFQSGATHVGRWQVHHCQILRGVKETLSQYFARNGGTRASSPAINLFLF